MSKLKSIAKQKRRQCRQERRAEKARKKKRAFLKAKNNEKYRSNKSKGRIIKRKQEKQWEALKKVKPKDYKMREVKAAWWKRVWQTLTSIFYK